MTCQACQGYLIMSKISDNVSPGLLLCLSLSSDFRARAIVSTSWHVHDHQDMV